MKKLFIILFFIFSVNISNSYFIENSENIRVSQAINFTGCNTENCNKTGSLNFSSYSGVYLKDIVCSGGKSFDSPYRYNTGTILQLIMSQNSSITGNWLNMFYNPLNVYNTQTFLNSVFTGSTLYWKVTNFYNTGTGITTFAPLLCYVNYTPINKNNNMNNNFFEDLQTYFNGNFYNNLVFILGIIFTIYSIIFIIKFGFKVGNNYFVKNKKGKLND